jgi:predicted nucleic acid-binding protein
MKKNIFIDTSAWLSLINKSDYLHKMAKNIRDNILNEK